MSLPDLKFETIVKHIHGHGFESLDPAEQKKANEVLQDYLAKERYENIAAEPRHWKESGDRLMAAANLIRRTHLDGPSPSVNELLQGDFDPVKERLESDMHRVYLFLAGFAIENYAKGAVIKMAPLTMHVHNGKLKGLNKTHDCLASVRQANITVKKSEEMTLKCVSNHVQWRGRYPVSNKYKGKVPRGGRQEFLKTTTIYKTS